MRLRFVQLLTGPQEALEALEAFTVRIEQALERGGIPPLYRSGVRYRRQARGANYWAMPRVCIQRGFADCAPLACWRAAELRASRTDRRAVTMLRHGNRQGLWHVLVRRGDGAEEDPSKLLGMKGSA